MIRNQKVVLICVLVSLSVTATSQKFIEYYDFVNEGEYKYNSGLFDDAIKAYKHAFSIEPPFGVDIYRMARCHCQINNTEKALKYLRLTGKEYPLDPKNYLSRDSLIFEKCLSVRQFNLIRKKMARDHGKSISKLSNSENYIYLLDTINYYIEADQKYRKRETNPCLEEDNSEFNCDSIEKEWFAHDSILYDQFIQFIKDNGYPKLAGELSYVILLHFHESHYKQSKQLLVDEVNKGNIDPFFLGMMFERLDLLVYGDDCTYYIWRKECDEEEWDRIIKNRKSIGMSIYYNGPRVRGEYNKIKLPWVLSQ
jgi:tetratricopeptide (TPR) repeat protein